MYELVVGRPIIFQTSSSIKFENSEKGVCQRIMMTPSSIKQSVLTFQCQ